MDREELRVRQAELSLAEVHHQTALRHSDLQRRFFFALALAGGLLVSLLRAEVPLWAALAAAPPVGWAWHTLRAMRTLAAGSQARAAAIIASLSPEVDDGPPPKDSPPRKVDERDDAKG